MESSSPRGGSTRRSFVKSACLMGLCACAGSSAERAVDTKTEGAAIGPADTGPGDPPSGMARKWIAALLPLMASIDPEEARRILKGCAAAHYEDLSMETVLERFRGDVPAFLDFLRDEGGWIVEYDPDSGVVLANENNMACVCPLVGREHPDDLGVLCSCSEGFAERMFSAVSGRPAHAEVTDSILRGGDRCRYRIELGARRA